MRTMVLEYLPTELSHSWSFYVGKYSSTVVRIWGIRWDKVLTNQYHGMGEGYQ